MFTDLESNYKTLNGARKAAVNNYKIGDYWTVNIIWYGTKKNSGKEAGIVYLPGWIGLKTTDYRGIYIPTRKGPRPGHDVTKARFVNPDGTLGASATEFWKKYRVRH